MFFTKGLGLIAFEMAHRADGERGRQIRAAVARGRKLLLEVDTAAAAAAGSAEESAESLAEDAAAEGGDGGGTAARAQAGATAGLEDGPRGSVASSSNGSSWELIEKYPPADVDAGLRDVRRMVAGTLQALRVMKICLRLSPPFSALLVSRDGRGHQPSGREARGSRPMHARGSSTRVCTLYTVLAPSQPSAIQSRDCAASRYYSDMFCTPCSSVWSKSVGRYGVGVSRCG